MKKIKIVFDSHAKELTELEVNTDTIIYPLKSVDFLCFLVYNTYNITFAMNLKRSGGVVIMFGSTKKTVEIIITKKKIKTVLANKAKELTGLGKLIKSKSKSNTGGTEPPLWEQITGRIGDKSAAKKQKVDAADICSFFNTLTSADISRLPVPDLAMLPLTLQCFLRKNKVLTLGGSSYAEALTSGLTNTRLVKVAITEPQLKILKEQLKTKGERKIKKQLSSLGIIKQITLKDKIHAVKSSSSVLITSFCSKYADGKNCTKSAAKDAIEDLADLQLRLRSTSDLTDCKNLTANLKELLNNQHCTHLISNTDMKSILRNFTEAAWVKEYEKELLNNFCAGYNDETRYYNHALSAMDKLTELKKNLNSKQNLSDCDNLYDCLDRLRNWLQLNDVDITHKGLRKVLNYFQEAYTKT